MSVSSHEPPAWHKHYCPHLTSQLEFLHEVDPLLVKYTDKTEQLLSVPPLRCFSLAKRHLFPVHYHGNNSGQGSCRVILGYESLQSPLKIAPTSHVQPVSQPDQQWRFSNVTQKGHPGAKWGRDARFSRHKRRWSNRAWVSGSTLIVKFTLGIRGPHSTDNGADCQSGKVLEPLALCIQPNLTSIFRTGSSNSPSRVMITLDSRPSTSHFGLSNSDK